MKINLDSFYRIKTKEIKSLSSFLADFPAENAPMSECYRKIIVTCDVTEELRRPSLLKCFPALFRKLFHDIHVAITKIG